MKIGWLWGVALFCGLGLLGGCATSPVKEAESLEAQDKWLKAVLTYRKARSKDPDSVELRSRLERAEIRAAEHYYHQGKDLLETGQLEGALSAFQQGLVAKPDYAKLRKSMDKALARRQADRLHKEGKRNLQMGRKGDARQLFKEALEADPDHKGAARALRALRKEEKMRESSGLALESREPVTLNFEETPLKEAFKFLGEQFGVNMIFDEEVESSPVTLFARNVTFRQGLNLLLRTSETFHKEIGANTVLIASDTEDKRGQYRDHIIRTFHLKTIKADRMADIIKGVLSVEKLIVNPGLNTVVVRDTEEIINQCERLIQLNDRRRAEVVMDVEILEVNRDRTETLGLDYGSQISMNFDNYNVADSFQNTLKSGTITMPTVTFRYLKQDVNAETLANPQIRVIDGHSSTIHIGDRIPLRSSTIQDNTGQVRTTFQYRDIGIKFEVKPSIHLDNSVTVDLRLEVSTLGQNLGTADQPAYSIGTRNAETQMLLRDGETAILGGLIREEERRKEVKVPGLGDIPLLGYLFSYQDESRGRSDVLLTLSPKVVRSWRLPPEEQRALFSGTKDTYRDGPVFGSLEEKAAGDVLPDIGMEKGPERNGSGPAQSRAEGGALENLPEPPDAARQPFLGFDQPVYEIPEGEEAELALVGKDLGGARNLEVQLLFNPEVVELGEPRLGEVQAEDFSVETDRDKGIMRLQWKGLETGEGEGPLAFIPAEGVGKGVSYLVYKSNRLKTGEGDEITAQVRAARAKVH